MLGLNRPALSTTEDRKNELAERIEASWDTIWAAQENGLFQALGMNPTALFQKLESARSNLRATPPNLSRAQRYFDEVELEYYRAINSRDRGMRHWRFFYLYAFHIWGLLVAYLVLIFILYSFLVHCNPNTGMCTIYPSFQLPFGIANPFVIKENNATLGATLGLGMGNTMGSENVQQPRDITREENLVQAPTFPQVGVYAVLWGAVGGILQGLYQLWQWISDRSYRKPWIIFCISTPFLGGLLGAIAYILLSIGLLTVAPMESQISPERFTLLVMAVAGYAGFRWKAAVEWFENVGGLIRTGSQK